MSVVLVAPIPQGAERVKESVYYKRGRFGFLFYALRGGEWHRSSLEHFPAGAQAVQRPAPEVPEEPEQVLRLPARFKEGSACRHCGGVIKRRANSGCVFCDTAQAKKHSGETRRALRVQWEILHGFVEGEL